MGDTTGFFGHTAPITCDTVPVAGMGLYTTGKANGVSQNRTHCGPRTDLDTKHLYITLNYFKIYLLESTIILRFIPLTFGCKRVAVGALTDG